jgi:hypothetical protein
MDSTVLDVLLFILNMFMAVMESYGSMLGKVIALDFLYLTMGELIGFFLMLAVFAVVLMNVYLFFQTDEEEG